MKKIRNELVPQINEIIYELDGDVFMLITGIYGGGKSTLGAQIAKMVWDGFDITDPLHCSFNWAETLASFKHPEIKSHLIDEGKRAIGGRMDFRTKQGGETEKILSESRQLNRCEIICVGEFERLLGFMADDRALLWLHVVSRGVVMVFQRLEYKLKGNKFGLDDVKWVKIKKEQDYLNRLMSLESFVFSDSFRKYSPYLTESKFSKYKERKLESFRMFIESLEKGQTEDRQKLAIGKVVYNLKRVHKWTWRDIMEITGYSQRMASIFEKDYLRSLSIEKSVKQ